MLLRVLLLAGALLFLSSRLRTLYRPLPNEDSIALRGNGCEFRRWNLLFAARLFN